MAKTTAARKSRKTRAKRSSVRSASGGEETAGLRPGRSESFLRALLESATQAILAVNRNGKIVLANDATKRVFGYSPDELIGQPLDLLVPQDSRGRHRAYHQGFFAHPRNRPMGIGLDLEGRRRDGTVFPIEASLNQIETPEGKLGVAFVADITERKRIEQTLRRREKEISTAFDNTPDVIMRLDRQFRYTQVNARTASVAGIPAEAFIGKTSSELGLPRDLIDLWMPVSRRVFETGQPDTVEFSYPGPSGTTEWEEQFIPEFGPDGSVETLLIIGHDVTERKRLERIAETSRNEIRALAASLMRVQEEERRRVSRELHDQICQQLASLAFDIGEFAAAAPPADRVSRLRALQARAIKASEEARHLAYELHPSVLDDLGLVASLRELCRGFPERAPNTAIKFKDSARPVSVPLEIASCLYRVAQESLQNIAKHANAKHVSVALRMGKGAVVLTIDDDGAGFDPQTVKSHGGLGLIGMAERARLLGGKLAITSQPGHGTQIALQVPVPADSP